MLDVLILGGGPAGLSAALSCARAGLTVTILEKSLLGGQIALAEQVENYPGFSGTGKALAAQMREQAEQFGASFRQVEVKRVELRGSVKRVEADIRMEAACVIIATGAAPRRLELPREQELTGRGISYCATCDGRFFRNKTVAVVGGGNTAVSDALLLSRQCKSVHLIHRRDRFRADAALQRRLVDANIIQHLDTQITALLGETRLTGLLLQDGTLSVDGLFIAIGRVPETALFRGQLDMDEQGYLLAKEDTTTELNAVFAAGDVRQKAVRQVVTAAADGAIAAHHAAEALQRTG